MSMPLLKTNWRRVGHDENGEFYRDKCILVEIAGMEAY